MYAIRLCGKEALKVAYCNREGVPRKQGCCTVKFSEADHDEFRVDSYLQKILKVPCCQFFHLGCIISEAPDSRAKWRNLAISEASILVVVCRLREMTELRTYR